MTESHLPHHDDTLDPRLRRAIESLPQQVEPPPEAFAAIRARIEAGRVVPMAGPRPGPSRSVVSGWRGWRLAAAAVLLVTASVAGTLRVVRSPAVRETAPEYVSPLPEAAAAARPVTMRGTTINAVFSDYESAARDLERVLDERRGRLSPSTVRTLTESLAVIDRAIGEARDALRRDPASRDLFDLLDSVYRQKLDLLRRANALPLHSS